MAGAEATDATRGVDDGGPSPHARTAPSPDEGVPSEAVDHHEDDGPRGHPNGEPLPPLAAPEEPQARLYAATAICVAGGAALWGLGRLWIRAGGHDATGWDAVWGLAGSSFLSSIVIPIPGITAALLFRLRGQIAGFYGVLGAAAGSVLASVLLLGIGRAGRRQLRKRATKSARSRRLLAWSTRLANRWTYSAIAALLVPQFIPKVVVLYAAVLARLRTSGFLAAVFVGVLVRNLLVWWAFGFIE